MEQSEAVSLFYLSHLQNIREEKTHLSADCPFCKKKGREYVGRLVVYLKKDGFFYGYFRCLNRCVTGGFPLWFARLTGISPVEVPGYDPDREYFQRQRFLIVTVWKHSMLIVWPLSRLFLLLWRTVLRRRLRHAVSLPELAIRSVCCGGLQIWPEIILSGSWPVTKEKILRLLSCP